VATIDKIAAAVREDYFHCACVRVYVGNLPWDETDLEVNAELKAGV
jgi:hypothetical protein